MKKLLVLGIIVILLLQVTNCTDNGGNQEEIEAFAVDFVDGWTAGNYDDSYAVLDSTMQAELSPDKMKEIWTLLIDQFGAFDSLAGNRYDTAQGFHIVFVTLAFEESSLDAKVVVNDEKTISGLFFVPTPPDEWTPAEYVDSTLFTETDVSFGEEEWKIEGTLSLPDGNGPFPALVLVHGTGPMDRDSHVGALRPFKDLAWGLASKGIAVLRYDKRTLTHSTAFRSLTDYTVFEETIWDAGNAVVMAGLSESVQKSDVFVLGHSLGGMLVPRINASSDDIAGFVIMAGNTRPLEDMYVAQSEYIAALDSVITDEEKASLEQMKAQAEMAKYRNLGKRSPSKDLPLNLKASYWIDLQGYDAPEMAKEINQPVLILQGERDYQVTMEDFQNWKDALSSKNNAEFKSYPSLNHFFVSGTESSTPGEYFENGHVDEEVINDIANWIKAQK